MAKRITEPEPKFPRPVPGPERNVARAVILLKQSRAANGYHLDGAGLNRTRSGRGCESKFYCLPHFRISGLVHHQKNVR